MAQQSLTGLRRLGGASVPTSAAPDLAVRLVGALLALGISTVHVADQGGITAFNSPAWIGWGYRSIEAGGVLTALVLLATFLPWAEWTGWAAGFLLGLGPFVAYLASRSIGIPGDPGDVGNWGDWTGTVSLFLEAALMVLCLSMLLSWRRHSRPHDS